MNGRSRDNLLRRSLHGPHRRHRRFRTRSLLLDNPVAGRVVNVGQGGLAVETPDGLTVGETYLFKVRLGDKHLRLSGRIQWCRLTGTEASGDSQALPVYRAGIALLEDVTSRAWQEALRRMTGGGAYLIWHRARGKGKQVPQPPLPAERVRQRPGPVGA